MIISNDGFRFMGFPLPGRRVLPDAPRLEQEDRLALDARPTNRPETAAQALDKAESAPGNGAEVSDPQDATPMRDEASASFLETPAQEFASMRRRPIAWTWRRKRPKSLNWRWPDFLYSAIEMAAANDRASEVSHPQDAAPARKEAFAPDDTPAPEFSAAPPADRLEMAPQELEKAESAPGNGMGAEWARPLGASFVSPAVASLSALRRVNVRATLNGVAAS